MKGQSAIEFVLLISVIFLVFVGYIAVVKEKVFDIAQQKDLELLQEYASFLQNEMVLASAVEDGYIRRFDNTGTIIGQPVGASLQIQERGDNPAAVLLVVNYTHALDGIDIVRVLPGNIRAGPPNGFVPGINCVSKQGGIVYLNRQSNCGQHPCLCS